MPVNTNDVKNQMKAQQQQTNQVPQQQPQSPGGSIAAYMAENMKAFKTVLPKHMTAERMARIALTEIRKNPELMKCNTASLGAAVMQMATLGLEPTVLGHCYLVPFNRKVSRKGQPDKWEKDVQFIIGYKGFIDLARRSGEVLSINAMEVRENDFFDYEYGLDERLKHRPAKTDRGAVTHYYAYAKFKDGGHTFLVMSKEDILEHAAQFTKQQNEKGFTGPWRNNFDSMAKKTVIRAMIKYMPLSIEVQQQFNTDERVIKEVKQYEDGGEIESDNIIDMADFEQAPEPQPAAENNGDEMTPEEMAELEKEMQQARKAQEEIDKKKNK